MRALVLTLLIGLLLAGCGTSNTSYQQYKGTDGLIIHFLDNAPPEKIYEARPFPVKFEIQNAGANNVKYSKMLVTFSYDPLYITGPVGIFDPTQYDAEQDKEHQFIQSRSVTYQQGEKRLFSIPTDLAFEAKPVYGQRESPETEIVASVCYAYTTYMSATVCIDTNIYNENERTQACKAKDISLSGGQGAPIAIEKVEVQMLPIINRDRTMESVKPEFVIHVHDLGNGYLIGPDTLEMKSACLLKDIPKDQLSSVLITAYLHNTKLECGATEMDKASGIIHLTNGEGEIPCTVPENELTNPIYLQKQNFESTLTVNITYLYKTTTKKELTIERASGTTNELPGLTPGKASGYLYEGDNLYLDASGRPVTLCSYYAANQNAIPATLKGRITSDMSCSCGSERCLRLSRDGKCVFGDICPSNTYCCSDTQGTTGANGVRMNIDQVTVYYTPDCSESNGWSNGGTASDSLGYCKITNPGFFQEVKCEGSGYCSQKYYSYSTITQNQATSPTAGGPKTMCGTAPVAHRTIAVNTRQNTPCYVPKGSTVKLYFGENNAWNGEYIAEDTGQAITGCHIDVYAGQGKAAFHAAQSALPGTAQLTILDSGALKCGS